MKRSIFWFRRDLRLEDNHGLFQALKNSDQVLPIFIFDTNIIDELASDDPRVSFIHQELSAIHKRLRDRGSGLRVFYGTPEKCWEEILIKFQFTNVYTNHDYEPYAKERDLQVEKMLDARAIGLHTFKDHVIFEKKEVLSAAAGVYTVFTPYKRKWLANFEEQYLSHPSNGDSFFPSENHLDKLMKMPSIDILTLKSMGFRPSTVQIPTREVTSNVLKNYEEQRNYPGLDKGTSKLGIYFRFGTISIRKAAMKACWISETYLSELIWRDFYAQILANYPHVVNNAFRSKYDRIEWRDSDDDFQKWCKGLTGYPIVDAGMRELNSTGFMHNRVRMVTASFLTKHLLIDWRRGETYFASRLLDFDLASNNGGWQWASGSGTDAAPYFRIFNPTSQMEKFDKDRIYIKKWVPEYGTPEYVKPMVDHKFARERCLRVYKEALAGQ